MEGAGIMEKTEEDSVKKSTISIENIDGIEYLSKVKNNSINLILTDPPYIISKDTGMNSHYNNVKDNKENGVEFVKTEEEWNNYKNVNNIPNDVKKDNYLRYGTIYGTKYCVKTDYGEWDSQFTMENLDLFVAEYYKKLKDGGTLIMFFDIWKISELKALLEKHKYKQIRFIEWIKIKWYSKLY